MVNIAVGTRKIAPLPAGRWLQRGYRAGRLAGRFYYLALIPVFVIGLGFALASAG